MANIKASSSFKGNFGFNNVLPKVAEYTKNLGKSVAYSTVDYMADSTANMRSFYETNRDVLKETTAAVRNYKVTIVRAIKHFKETDIYAAAIEVKDNAISDLKTGKFYNKEREDKYKNESGKAMYGGDEGFALSDDDLFADSSSSSDDVESSFEAAFNNVSQTVGNTVISASEYVASVNRSSTKVLYAQNEQLFGMVAQNLTAIRTGISSIAATTPLVRTHMNDSRTYYTESTKLMQEHNAMLKEIVEMQRAIYKKDSKSSYKESPLDTVMDSNGNIDIKEYVKQVSKNIGGTLDVFGIGGMADTIGGTKNMIRLMLGGSPLKALTTGIVSLIIPSALKQTLKSIDDGFGTMFSTLMAKAKNAAREDTGIRAMLGSIFGISGLATKNQIDTSRYEKGPVPFDGITRQAIIEVIPGYLRRIESALTGTQERVYNSATGKWQTVREIKQTYDKIEQSNIIAGTSDIRNTIEPYLRELEKANKEQAKLMQSNVETLLTNIYKNNGIFDPYNKSAKYYGLNDEDFKILTDIIMQNKTAVRKTPGSVLRQKDESTRYYMNAEQGIGPMRELFNNSVGQLVNGKVPDVNGTAANILNAAQDKHGHNIFHYLRNMLAELTVIRQNGGGGGRRRGKGSGGYRGPINPDDVLGDSIQNADDEASTVNDYDARKAALEELRSNQKAEAEFADKQKTARNRIAEELGLDPNAKLSDQLLAANTIGQKWQVFQSNINQVLSKPTEWLTASLTKVDQHLFDIMFGEKHKVYIDRNGKEAKNISDVIIMKLSDTFDELKKKLNKIFNPLLDKFNKLFKPFLDPIKDSLKDKLVKGKNQVLASIDNVFRNNRLYQKILRLRGGYHKEEDDYSAYEDSIQPTTSADDLTDSAGYGTDYYTDSIIGNHAKGKVVTKYGLAMLSPGEIVIPASPRAIDQNRDLLNENIEKRKIIDAIRSGKIGNHAKGKFNFDAFKDDNGKIDYKQIKEALGKAAGDNRYKIADVASSGIIGGGLGLLTPFGPLGGAIIGSAISIVKNSEYMQKVLFGDGTEEGKGIVPEKVTKFFKKNLPNMRDYGIVGGIAGLFTPFGPLGGAMIGAGIGYLKDSEKLKSILFGEMVDGEETKPGIIPKGVQDKVKKIWGEGKGRVLPGAVAGAVLGPFGIVGGAMMGAAVGLLSTTNTFKNLMFGEEDENGNRVGGIADAFKEGFVDPLKTKVMDFGDKFKDYTSKYVLDPMKKFIDPVGQMIRNMFNDIGDSIKDRLKGIIGDAVGVPLKDFMRRRVFQPAAKAIGGVASAGIKAAGAVVGLPFRAIGGIGNSIRSKQIRRGTASDMTASERLQFREDHPLRSAGSFLYSRGQNYQPIDEMLANADLDQLTEMGDLAENFIEGSGINNKKYNDAIKKTTREISNYLNSETDENGTKLLDRLGYRDWKRFQSYIKTGNEKKAKGVLKMNNRLSREHQNEIMKMIDWDEIGKLYENRNKEGKSRDRAMTELSRKLGGHKFKSVKDVHRLMRNIQTETKDRKAQKAGEEETTGDPVVDASIGIQKHIVETNQLLKDIITVINNIGKKPGDPDYKPLDSDASDAALRVQKAAERGRRRGGGAREGSKTVYNDDGTRTVHTPHGLKHLDADGNPMDDKETQDTIAKEEEAAKHEEARTTALDKISEATSETADAVTEDEVGGKKKKKKGIMGILSTIGGGILNIFGVGSSIIGKLGLGILGVSLAGHASEWLKNTIVTPIKNAIFGTKSDGEGSVFQTALQKYLGGPINKVVDVVGKVYNWFTSGEALNWGVNFITEGIKYSAQNLVEPIVTAIIKAAPAIISGIIKGIAGVFKKSTNNINLDNPYSEGYGQEETAATTESTGLLGNQRRQNVVQYDENGNTITDLAVNNTEESLASKVVGISSRAFLQTLGGGANTLGRVAGKLAKTNINPLKMHGGITSRIFKTVGGGVAKVTGGTIGAAANLGTRLRTAAGMDATSGVVKNFVNKVKDSKVGQAASTVFSAADDVASDVVDDVASKAAGAVTDAATSKTGLLGRIGKKITEWLGGLADTPIGAKFLKGVKLVGGTGADNVFKQGLEILAEKLTAKIGQNVASTGLKTIASSIAKFSPIVIITTIADFMEGFNNAETFLGVTKGDYDVSMLQRCIIGLVNVISKYLTFGFIDAQTILELCINTLCPIFGIDVSTLEAARAQAVETLNQWNKENPDETYDNIEDFNNKDKLSFKIKKGLSNVLDTITGKNKTTSATTAVTASTSTTAGSTVDPLTGETGSSMGSIISAAYKDAQASIKKAMEGKISIFDDEYWDQSDSVKGTTVGHAIGTMLSTTIRVLNTPVVILGGLFGKLGSFVDGIKDWFGNTTYNIKKFFGLVDDETDDLNNYASGSSRTVVNGRVVGTFGGGKGRNISMKDGDIRNVPYANTTLGEAGCGPIAAYNTVRNMSGRGTAGVKNAANYALQGGYTSPDGGTNINYFNDYFSANGIPNAQTTNPSDVMNTLANGGQAVLLGQNSGGGKSSTYSSNPHYINATGLDKNGNIIVNDPDLGHNTRHLSPNKVFNGMRASVLAGRAREDETTNSITNMMANSSVTNRANATLHANADNSFLNHKESAISSAISSVNTGVNKTLIDSLSQNSSLIIKDSSKINYGTMTDEELISVIYSIVTSFESGGGQYDAINAKDSNGACAVGVIQWNGDRAKNMLAYLITRHPEIDAKEILGNYLYNDITGSTKWSKRSLSTTEVSRLKRFLTYSDEIKHTQRQFAYNEFQNYIDVARKLGLKDKQAIAYFCDMYNFGPTATRRVTSGLVDAYGSNVDLDKIHLAAINDSVYSGQIGRRNKVYSMIKSSTKDFLNYAEDVQSTESTVDNTESSSNTIFDAISNLGVSMIKAIFGEDAYNAFFGATDSSTTSTSSGTVASGDWSNLYSSGSDGVVTDEQVALVQKMQSKLGKIHYSCTQAQDIDNNVGSCASTVGWAYNKVLGDTYKDMSARCTLQIKDDRLKTIANFGLDPNNLSGTAKVDESLLEPGDLIYYRNKGDNGAYRIGHVEMYKGNGEVIGHGGPSWNDMGTRVRKLSSNASNAIVARRALPFLASETTTDTTSTTGTTFGSKKGGSGFSTSPTSSTYDSTNMTGYGRDDTGSDYTNNGSIATDTLNSKTNSYRQARVNNAINASVGQSSANNSSYTAFLESIITILTSIASNTNLLSQILEILSNNFGIDIDSSLVKSATDSTTKAKMALADLQSKEQTTGISTLLQNKDTSYILSVMTALARE